MWGSSSREASLSVPGLRTIEFCAYFPRSFKITSPSTGSGQYRAARTEQVRCPPTPGTAGPATRTRSSGVPGYSAGGGGGSRHRGAPGSVRSRPGAAGESLAGGRGWGCGGTGPGLRGHASWKLLACVSLMASERERCQCHSVGKDPSPEGRGLPASLADAHLLRATCAGAQGTQTEGGAGVPSCHPRVGPVPGPGIQTGEASGPVVWGPAARGLGLPKRAESRGTSLTLPLSRCPPDRRIHLGRWPAGSTARGSSCPQPAFLAAVLPRDHQACLGSLAGGSGEAEDTRRCDGGRELGVPCGT